MLCFALCRIADVALPFCSLAPRLSIAESARRAQPLTSPLGALPANAGLGALVLHVDGGGEDEDEEAHQMHPVPGFREQHEREQDRQDLAHSRHRRRLHHAEMFDRRQEAHHACLILKEKLGTS